MAPLAPNNHKHKQQGADGKRDHSAEMMRSVSQLHCFSRPIASSWATCEFALFPAVCGSVNDSLFLCWCPESKEFPHKVTQSDVIPVKPRTLSFFFSLSLSPLGLSFSSPTRLYLKSSNTAGKTNSARCLLQTGSGCAQFLWTPFLFLTWAGGWRQLTKPFR